MKILTKKFITIYYQVKDKKKKNPPNKQKMKKLLIKQGNFSINSPIGWEPSDEDD